MARGAIVGLGNVALKAHLSGWKNAPGVQIVAGIDAAADRRQLFQKEVPEATVFGNLDECAGLPLDFIDICTPPHTHYPLILKGLEKKLDVMCEKPLILSEPQLQSLEDAMNQTGKTVFTVHNWRFAPICLKISELIQSGQIGRIEQLAWYVLRNGPAQTTLQDNWRLDPEKAGGGILIDHGWHAFYLVLSWMGCNPNQVECTLENRQYEDLPVEDTARIKLEFEPAAGITSTAEIFLTWASRLRRNWGVIRGSEGTLRVEDDILFVDKGANSESYKFDYPLSQGSQHPEWFHPVTSEFLSEMSGSEPKGKNFAMAKACLMITERSKQSHLKGSALPFFSKGTSERRTKKGKD